MLPLVWLVSGRKYALLYVAVTLGFELPYIFRMLLQLVYLWPAIASYFHFAFQMISTGGSTQTQDALIGSYLNGSGIPSAQKGAALEGLSYLEAARGGLLLFFAALGALTVCLGVLYVMVRSTVRELRLYLGLLRRAAEVAKGYHR